MSSGDIHQPRLATLRKWQHFNGYGFNLHAERGKAGQYIGKVDEGSPAEAAGLKQGDRIVEVDGTNIGNENHQQVVGRIKAGGDQTTLLVVDTETDKYFKEQRVVVRSDMPEIRKLDSLTGPRPAGGSDTNEETGENIAEINGITNAEIERDAAPSSQNEIDLDSDAEEVVQPVVNDVVERSESVEVEAVHIDPVEAMPDYDEPESNTAEFTPPPPPVDEPEDERPITPEFLRDPSPEPSRDPLPDPEREPTPEPVRAPTPEPVRAPTPEPVRAPTPEPVRAPTPEPVRAPTPEPVRPPTPEPVRTEQPEPTPTLATNDTQANGDPLKHMSAKQLREQLAAKKKADAKSKKIGFKDKYEIFQKL